MDCKLEITRCLLSMFIPDWFLAINVTQMGFSFIITYLPYFAIGPYFLLNSAYCFLFKEYYEGKNNAC